VRNLAPTTTSDDLTQLFSQTYPIKHAVAVLDAPPHAAGAKACRGYGFVTFADPADAVAARAALHGSELLGHRVIVEQAQVRRREDGEDAPRPGRPDPSKLPSTKLIVRNLPWSVNTVDKFAALFRSFGRVNEAILPKNSNGKLRGFGIVMLRGRKNAERAMEMMNGKEVDGRTIAVDWAADRETWEKAKQAETSRDRVENGSNADENEASDVEMEDVDDSMDEEDVASSQNDEEDEGEEDEPVAPNVPSRPNNTPSTVFIRNLPYSCTDEDLTEHFEQFGQVRYARVVYDSATGQSKGTGFVCFRREEDATRCAKEAPQASQGDKGDHAQESVLQDYSKDPTGEYTLDGRVLSVTKAVEKDEAVRLNQRGVQLRNNRDKDKRRLYLLTEGRIKSNSDMYEKLSATEIAMREASAKQRKALVEKNPALHLSLTRLSVRNIPKFVTSKDLKALARDAFVGFATDVKNGLRQKLSPEEIARGGEEMKAAEHERKAKGKGVVKQAKVVFETKEGSKIAEADGAGRSRGYGFIEYHTHRSALMGLRWLNGREVDLKSLPSAVKGRDASAADRKRRLIVEFALENVNVVKRRGDREVKARTRPADDAPAADRRDSFPKAKGDRRNSASKPNGDRRASASKPNIGRGRNSTEPKRPPKRNHSAPEKPSAPRIESAETKEKTATTQRIIARKRTARRARKPA
jgi:nucleolar protein 4